MTKKVIFLGGGPLMDQTLEFDKDLDETFMGYNLHIGGVDDEEHYVFDTSSTGKTLDDTFILGHLHDALSVIETNIDSAKNHIVASIDWYKRSLSDASTSKSLGNTCSNGAKKNVKDIVFWGDGDTFKLISKASSENEGWMKSTKAMQCGDSVVVQVTTQQRNPDGSYSLAEALTTVANAKIVVNGNSSEGTTARRIINN